MLASAFCEVQVQTNKNRQPLSGMMITIREKEADSLVTKSNLPFCDYVINPYVGCPHACRYYYASFMKRFTGHTGEWGSFTDVKVCKKRIDASKLDGKAVFLSSVTDPYNPVERERLSTRKVLEQICEANCRIYVSTKSPLVTRDIDLLKRCRDVVVAVSLNTLDDGFRRDMDRAGSVGKRLEALRELHDSGIHTVLFVSPWFPGLTDFRALIDATREFADEYWFENLNLRGDYKARILSYIDERHPELSELYDRIYNRKDETFWAEKEREFGEYCGREGIRYVNAFHHSKLVSEKKRTGELVRRDRASSPAAPPPLG